MKVKSKRLICFILIIYNVSLCLGIPVAASEAALPETAEVLSENVEVGSRFLELFFGEGEKKKESVSLLPGGNVFGVKM